MRNNKTLMECCSASSWKTYANIHQKFMIGEISLRGATPIVMGTLIATRYTRILDVTLLPLRHYPDGHHFQQDNDPKHMSSWRAYCERKGINWWANLASSPDLNSMENIWASTKQYLCINVKPKNTEDLKAGIQEF